MSNPEEVVQTALAEIVRKVQIEDGDILIVKTYDDDVMVQLVNALSEMYNDNRKFMLVEQSQLDILREADEEIMREMGWQKIK